MKHLEHVSTAQIQICSHSQHLKIMGTESRTGLALYLPKVS